MDTKNVMLAFLGGIGILLALFGLQIYVDLAPQKLLDSDINIIEAQGNLENERILTVDIGDKNVVLYSFDDGKTFQTQNTYSVSENKVIKVVLKDNERRVVGKKVYKVQVVDSTGPVITLNNVPNTIYVGSNIDLNKYASAVDSNNNPVNINVNANGFDNNKAGTYNITYTAIDKNNLKAEVTIELRVVNRQIASQTSNPTPTPSASTTPSATPKPTPAPTETVKPTPTPNPTPSPSPSTTPKTTPTKVTYYRYRTKSTLTYDCNYYACDYVDYDNTKDYTYIFNKDSFCCVGTDCTKSMPKVDANSICLFNYIDGGTCVPSGQEFVDRYASRNNICYDRNLIFNENSSPISLKSACSDNEILIDGYCHKIDSYGNATCPDGYVEENGNCYKKIRRTCNNHCTSETWSTWSNWSTTKVVASDYTEVQTKVE